MAYKENYNEQMREYMARRYEKRLADATQLLGGRCVDCGSTERLHFDHVDPATKLFTICRRLASAPWQTILDELAKCVLRCQPCHIKKSQTDGSRTKNRSRGERVSGSKLTATDVKQIRKACRAGRTHRSVAEEYGVTRGNISFIVRGITWQHVAE